MLMQAKAMSEAGAQGPEAQQAVMDKMSPAQLQRQMQTQLKMFQKNPDSFRAQLGDNPMKDMSNEEIEGQLKSMAEMDPETLNFMMDQQKRGGDMSPEGQAQMIDNMDDEQLKKMVSMQKKMFQENPETFRKMMPAMAGLSDSAILQQLEMLEQLDGTNIRRVMAAASWGQWLMTPLRTYLGPVVGPVWNLVRDNELVPVLVVFVLVALISWVVQRVWGPFVGQEAVDETVKQAEKVVKKVVKEAVGVEEDDEEVFFGEDDL